MDHINLTLSGNIISKTYIWRAASRTIKSELINQGYNHIGFLNYVDKDNYIKLITENKYEVNDIVSAINSDGISVDKQFTVKVSVIEENSQLVCKVDNYKIMEDKQNS